MQTEALPTESKVKTHTYWPEFDFLRFFAFLAVFFFHGPRLVTPIPILNTALDKVFGGLAYGLALFFFLSSFLITTLLLRERAKTGSVHLKLFYVRRLLRIWPLYYFALAMAMFAPFIAPANRFTPTDLLQFALFVGYFALSAHGNPFGVLWSISVEELFYAIWPWVAKWGRHRLTIFSAVTAVAAILVACFNSNLWYNPLSQFLFFASGALLAIWARGRSIRLSAAARLALLLLGIGSWATIPPLFSRMAPYVARPSAFLIADLGCVLIFFAVLQMKVTDSPFSRAVLYLGRISYGLYVFHLYCFGIVRNLFAPIGMVRTVATWAAALLLAILFASASYAFLEMPFLRLKNRYNPAT